MTLMVYNTLSRHKEEFVPMNGKAVNMFVCGQTVYDDAHLGHAKAYISFDIVARWLRYSGYKLKYIQNITDVDDKIIIRAKERGIDPFELAREYEKRFLEDMEAIGVKETVSEYPRSHDFIEAITGQIQKLIDNGVAYMVDDDIYFNVDKFPDYTKLSGMKIDELGKHRIEPKEGKINQYDFALWKAAKQGEPSWKITLKVNKKKAELNGRPGWHIEDTAITHEIFGPQYDLHGGASELIFPHHTNEIAQSEAAYGKKPFVKYWMHCGILNIKGVKMSKSLKNFVTIREVLKDYDAEVLRYLFASTHYRKEVNYTEELMDTARKQLGYMYSAMSLFYNMPEKADKAADAEVAEIVEKLKKEFSAAMDDDINTSLALSRLVIAINQLRLLADSKKSVSKQVKDEAIKEILSLANVLNILRSDSYKRKIPEAATSLIKEREQLRKKKKFLESDAIRARLKDEFKISIEDSETGTLWYWD
ncbi:MAG: cysteine--tRNA ligase [Candidatus Micrarchaeota archaeon]|nr:cysteine--tRNA ligase [Candidatus Micrarchaeota archaeon]